MSSKQAQRAAAKSRCLHGTPPASAAADATALALRVASSCCLLPTTHPGAAAALQQYQAVLQSRIPFPAALPLVLRTMAVDAALEGDYGPCRTFLPLALAAEVFAAEGRVRITPEIEAVVNSTDNWSLRACLVHRRCALCAAFCALATTPASTRRCRRRAPLAAAASGRSTPPRARCPAAARATT